MQFNTTDTIAAATTAVTTKSPKNADAPDSAVGLYQRNPSYLHIHRQLVAAGYTLHYLSRVSEITPSGLQGRSWY